MRRYIGLAFVVIAAATLGHNERLRTAGVAAHGAPGRISEPVVLTGAELPDFAGATEAQLWAYAYDHGAWELLPLQMDERAANGNMVPTENGTLDANDEIVFMADLVGAQRPQGARPPGTDLCYPTAEVALTDPLDAEWTGYVYLFRSLTGPEPAFPPAVAWDPATHELTSEAYTLGFANPAADGFFGIKTLRLFSGAGDLLDRMKIRVEVTLFGTTVTYTEESDTLSVPDVEAVSTGTVRVVLNDAGTAAAYGRRVQLSSLLGDLVPSVPGLLTINDAQVALDFLPSAGQGSYLDANAASPVVIDGVADTVAAMPWSPWRSVEFLDGRLVTLGGEVSPADAASNMFLDGAPFPRDTGDGVTHGQVGVQAGSMDALLQADFPGEWVFLSPGQGFEAATLYSQAVEPLGVTVSFDAFTPSCPTPVVSDTPTPTPTGSATTPAPTPTPTMFDDGPCGDGRRDCFLYLPQTRNEKDRR
jgi:hypothetical protein